jgi:CheY-like chemotaxis protein/two-component sensor histidine kinase
MRGIVRDLHLFSRAHDDERESVDVHEVIETTLRLAWNEIRHRARVVRDYCDSPLVDSNAARLGQILLNLFVNAAQAMPVGRTSANTLRVSTKKDGKDWLLVEVTDTGTGMPQDVLARVFDPFFTTKAAGSGTGLGLSLCHRMINDLGGAISVESVVGSGSSFRLRLPVATRPLRAAAPASIPAIAAVRSRILVIDDEVAIGRVLERGLHPHHDVVVLTRGDDALKRIASGERFDAILCDLMMPEVTGMDIYLELSKTAEDQARRMVFLSGGAFTDRGRAFLAGIPNKRIEKPFVMTDVLTVLADVVSR